MIKAELLGRPTHFETKVEQVADAPRDRLTIIEGDTSSTP